MSKFEVKMKKLMDFHSEEINKIRDQNLNAQKNREKVLLEERRKFSFIRKEIDTLIELIKKKHIRELTKIEIFDDRKLIIKHESVDYYGPIVERRFMYGSDNKEQQYGVSISTTTINDDGSIDGDKDYKNKDIIFKNKDHLLNHLHDTIQAILEKDIEDRD